MKLNSLLVTLVRHGESQDNLQSIWAGFRDSSLSTTGVSQARALGQAFSNVNLTAIYCSDLKRAAMTAEEILNANRSIPPPPLVQSKSLREQNFGQAEGMSWAAAEWANPAHGEDGRTFRFKDGESLEEVNARMAKAVRQFVLPRVEALRKKAVEGPAETTHICIVAHGIAIAELLRVFMSLHDEHPNSPWPDPRQTYKRVRLENTGWTRLEISVPALDQDLPTGGFSPGQSSLAPTHQTSTSTNASGTQSSGSGHADFGEIQTEIVENAAASNRPLLQPSHDLTGMAHSKHTFVKIVVQNHVDHLRGFSLQPPSMASGGPANQLAGGTPSSKSVGGSPTPGTGTMAAASNQVAPGGAGLPASGTLASIASNATLSTSASTATLPPPSTPGPSSAAASRSVAATPASARSLSSYGAKMMAKELERAGAASMLAGTEGGGVQASGGSAAQGTSGSSNHTTSQAGPSSSQAAPERPAMQMTSTSSSTLHSLSANQIPTSASSLYSTYAATGASPNGAQFGFHMAPGAGSDVWQSICVRVLPLFNGEGLRSSIEELNESVSQHVRRTLDRGPARALDSLSLDLISLASSGTLTLNSKLLSLNDARLLVRLVEIWTFFLGQVLPYIEGCFLPLQTDPVLVSLTTNARAANAATAQATFSPTTSSALRIERIDVRKILLSVFRDQVILLIYERLFYLFAHITELDPAFTGAEDTSSGDGTKQVYLRLLQMTSVLSSVLSDDGAQNAIDGLLRALRIGIKGAGPSKNGTNGTRLGLGMRSMSPVQRSNRRGWIPQKARKHGISSSADSFGLGKMDGALGGHDQVQHPRMAAQKLSINADRGKRFGNQLSEDDYLTALRSPNGSPAVSTPGTQFPPTPPSKENTFPRDGYGEQRQEEADSADERGHFQQDHSQRNADTGTSEGGSGSRDATESGGEEYFERRETEVETTRSKGDASGRVETEDEDDNDEGTPIMNQDATAFRAALKPGEQPYQAKQEDDGSS